MKKNVLKSLVLNKRKIAELNTTERILGGVVSLANPGGVLYDIHTNPSGYKYESVTHCYRYKYYCWRFYYRHNANSSCNCYNKSNRQYYSWRPTTNEQYKHDLILSRSRSMLNLKNLYNLGFLEYKISCLKSSLFFEYTNLMFINCSKNSNFPTSGTWDTTCF